MSVSKKNKIISEALIELKPSKLLKGEIGMFAVRNLRKGTIVGDIAYFNDEVFYTRQQYEACDKKTQLIIDKFCIPTPKGFYGPSNINCFSIPWYMNHSCSGNVGFDARGNFITIKYVRRGEELSYDFSFTGAKPKNFKYCKCGSKNCRKIITGDEWKIPAYRQRYFKYFMPELKQLLKTLGIV